MEKTNHVGVSVIMLTYNRAEMVKTAIDSVLSQTYTDYEYIIIDNGSEDDTARVLQEYRSYEKIHVFAIGKHSIGYGRNYGISKACGKYITFLDDDDWLEPDFLKMTVGELENSGADISICGSNLKEFAGNHFVWNAKEAEEALLDRKYFSIAFPGKLIKTDLFKGHRFQEVTRFDDIYLMPEIIGSAKKIVYNGMCEYHFCRHDHNTSAWTTDFKLLTPVILSEYLFVYAKRTLWLTKRFPDGMAHWNYYEWSFWLSMVEKIDRFHLSDCADLQSDMLDGLRSAGEKFTDSVWLKDYEREWIQKYL